jgi:GT2 family glycosyltransferase
MIKVAIVITCYNQSRYTKQAIESLKSTVRDDDTYCFDFAVFDDSSTDNSEETVRRSGGDAFIYWRSNANSGLTYAWNAAYRMFSEYDYIALVNNDVVFSSHWLNRILDAMVDSKCQMAGPISNCPGHIEDQDVRKFITGYEPLDDWNAINWVAEQVKGERAFRVDRINGFCMVFLSDFLHFAQIGRAGLPFDPRNRNFGNEDEIQRRLRPVSLVVSSSFVFHYKRVSIQGRPRDFCQYRSA